MDYAEFRRLEFERRDLRLQNSQPMKLQKTERKRDWLHIVYVMTWTGICGGSKIIFQHCNHLVQMGHRVSIVCHFPRPIWFPLDARIAFVQAPIGEVLCEYIPACDVIVATYWKEIYECVEQKIAPVIYFEQGDTHLFHPEALNAHMMQHIKTQIALAPFVFTVSSFASDMLRERFSVQSAVIPNAVDKSVFYPGSSQKDKGEPIIITAIGSCLIHFKCIPQIITAIETLQIMGYSIEFIWISPDATPCGTTTPTFVKPNQETIGDCLRRSDIYVCASQYESFCLPVLEAMTCGVAVVTTDNGGVRDFVKDQENALIIAKNDVGDMVKKIELLILNPSRREEIASNGLITAQQFDWKLTTEKLSAYYMEIASYEVVR